MFPVYILRATKGLERVMKDLESNKIFAAVLLAGIIAMFAGFIAEIAIPDHGVEEFAVPIEGVETVSSGPTSGPSGPEPILSMIADAEVARGQKVAKACAACHSFDKGGPNGVGPNLWGVVGAQKQAHAGFDYSGALNANGEETWTYSSLNKYLYKPKEYAPGTKMNFIGLKKPDDRAAVIAYLRTLADTPPALPSEAEIAAEQEELGVEEEAEGDAAAEGEGETTENAAEEDGTPEEVGANEAVEGGDDVAQPVTPEDAVGEDVQDAREQEEQSEALEKSLEDEASTFSAGEVKRRIISTSTGKVIEEK